MDKRNRTYNYHSLRTRPGRQRCIISIDTMAKRVERNDGKESDRSCAIIIHITSDWTVNTNSVMRINMISKQADWNGKCNRFIAIRNTFLSLSLPIYFKWKRRAVQRVAAMISSVECNGIMDAIFAAGNVTTVATETFVMIESADLPTQTSRYYWTDII